MFDTIQSHFCIPQRALYLVWEMIGTELLRIIDLFYELYSSSQVLGYLASFFC
jgi:hypothetical protein